MSQNLRDLALEMYSIVAVAFAIGFGSAQQHQIDGSGGRDGACVDSITWTRSVRRLSAGYGRNAAGNLRGAAEIVEEDEDVVELTCQTLANWGHPD